MTRAWVWLIATLAMPALSGDGIFDEYRDLMGDDNPAIFVIDEGEALWFEPQGPLAVSLEGCDLGLGAGVTEGAYALFPRYFEDTNTVMDVESRLCLLYTSPSPRDKRQSRMPSSA